ncbi:hypothetical protein [Xanthomonas graminis]|jgi:hypothetical protein|uniref:Uncharacterized protein n=3 Tax=Xanthomonas translucens group TaxID=3390202 RepID=A0A0K3A7S4_9XANT|nr:hypothetical protein [Xanthomonas translucens]EKU26760.1 hypothetical protein XTG29_00068 [Xanthomonas translucens pv. graminis ART-Xtg29]OAX62202.1 hypothetical protein A6R72_09920 [Xanthomonas translucens pv. graminis]UKE54508.1 hypothetical protein KFS84_00405 [Xanthomonas translucens pv. graminis]UKE61913.1 hypothetical protein KM539_19920 [Xanthomonas translucens pv. poae]UKE73327.1 hypothetical protein KFS85_20365 [Xanthomonas translucens pv. phleipratensis]
MIDWPNILATLAAAAIGGWVAAGVASRQIQASLQVEREKVRQETSKELIEAIDSFVHIAYRHDNEEKRHERQRLRRRILSLTALALPEQFSDTQRHLDMIDRWWWRKQYQPSAPPIQGTGFTATNDFFEGVKTRLFRDVFGQRIEFSGESERTDAAPNGN